MYSSWRYAANMCNRYVPPVRGRNRASLTRWPAEQQRLSPSGFQGPFIRRVRHDAGYECELAVE